MLGGGAFLFALGGIVLALIGGLCASQSQNRLMRAAIQAVHGVFPRTKQRSTETGDAAVSRRICCCCGIKQRRSIARCFRRIRLQSPALTALIFLLGFGAYVGSITSNLLQRDIPTTPQVGGPVNEGGLSRFSDKCAFYPNQTNLEWFGGPCKRTFRSAAYCDRMAIFQDGNVTEFGHLLAGLGFLIFCAVLGSLLTAWSLSKSVRAVRRACAVPLNSTLTRFSAWARLNNNRASTTCAHKSVC